MPHQDASAAAPAQHPVQNHHRIASVPASVALRAYEVYCANHGPQPAMVDVEGRGSRGGFHASELIAFLYARSFPPGEWRRREDEALEQIKLA